ncbi:hypothetical protein [Mesorhizobium sp. M0977]|uniref:hypothetical protein n=1 Tax=Mesorhizobium sp. M0977 TaxID=2957039 RepID=UPI003338A1EC
MQADQDVGILIITQMLERLYFAELVLADMTIPNGNGLVPLCSRLPSTWARRTRPKNLLTRWSD